MGTHGLPNIFIHMPELAFGGGADYTVVVVVVVLKYS